MSLRLIVAVTLIALAAGVGARTIIVVPHPDDESIGIAGTIRQKVLAGDDVFVVVATHGEASGVRRILNGELSCSLCGRTHNPMTEGFLSADLSGGLLTIEGFGNARLREFQAAMDALGVPTANRQVYNFGDGQITSVTATTLLDELILLYGTDANYVTVQGSSDTTHRDHIALAEALAAHSAIPENRKSYYRVYIYGTSNPTGPGQKDVSAWQSKKAEALECYSYWAPGVGRYRIGRHSVNALITNAASSPYEFALPLPSRVEDWTSY